MTLEQILALVFPHLPAVRRDEYAPFMEDAFAEFEITTKLRLAAVLGQLGVESRELAVWEENLNYSAQRLCAVWPKRFPSLAAAAPFAHNPRALANKVYGGRMGNSGSEDGWKYRGRTPVQLTGRDMYVLVGEHLRLPLEANPDMVNSKEVAFRAVGCFFRDIKRILHLADQRQFRAVTIAVNGGLTDWATRLQYYERALRVIPDNFHLDLAGTRAQSFPVLPDLLPADVHQPTDDELAPAPGPEQPDQPDQPDQPEQPQQPTPPSPPAPPPPPDLEPEKAQKVHQSLGSKVMAWWPAITGPVAGFWLTTKDYVDKHPQALIAGAIIILGGLAVAAWIWNESKKRQAAQQHKLIEMAAAPDKHTVLIEPPPAKAG